MPESVNVSSEICNEELKKIKDIHDRRSKSLFYTLNLWSRTVYYGHIIKKFIIPIFRENFGEDLNKKEFKIFDYGIGDGQKLEKFINSLGLSNPKNEVYSCDISDGMINNAKKRFSNMKYEVNKIDIYSNYNAEPDIKYSDIDIFLINQVLHFYNKENKIKILEDAYKSMSKGGLLLLLDGYIPSDIHRSIDDPKPKILKTLKGNIFKACVNFYEEGIAGKNSYYITTDEMSEILKKIGFEICGIQGYKSLGTGYMFGGINRTTQIICKK